MSVTISFISATAEELDRAAEDPDWASEFLDELYEGDDGPGRPDGGPDKAWGGLQYLFDKADVYLEFLMEGYSIGEDGTLFGWPVEDVASLAAKLQATPWEQLAAHYEPELMAKEEVYPNCWKLDPEGELEWLESAYGELVAFFAEAAEGGYGAFMMFSF
jgi:hypothetical protein